MKSFIDKYFEQNVDPKRWLWFQKLFYAALLLQFVSDFYYYTTSLKVKPSYNPLPLLEWITPERPAPEVYMGVLYALIALLVLGLILSTSKIVQWGVLFLSFWIMAVALSLDKAAENDYVFHSKNLVVFVLLIIAVAPKKIDKVWPITLVRLSLGLVYFGSFYTRFIHAGFEWMDGNSLRSILYFHGYLIEKPASLWLANQAWLCVLLSVAIVVFEATFVVFVLHPLVSLLYAVAGIAFHLGIYYFLNINFLEYHLFAYLVFVVGGLGLKARAKI